MKMQAMIATLVLGTPFVAAGVARAQMMEPPQASQASMSTPAKAAADDDLAPPSPAQQQAARTFAANSAATKAAQSKKLSQISPKPAALTPLSPRERVAQLLDRFTFGPRPGEVDRVLAQGEDQWLAAQLNPDAINDDRLAKRLADYPALALTPDQVLKIYPDRSQIAAVEQGKTPYPTDPLQNSVFEVQVYKLHQEEAERKVEAAAIASHMPPPEKSDEEKAAQHKQDQATAGRIFGELYALPKDKRMAALIAMPVEDRAIFTGEGNLTGEQRNQLMADFSPREREGFYGMAGKIGAAYKSIDEIAAGRVLRDILSERQLQAVMSDFWFNHFNVYFPKDADQWYTASYERDVIRKNALTTFPQLLMATAQSPAMMIYLDNWLSIGPDSIANGVDPANPNAKRGTKGLNENYGREVMELHTVGVNGGYTQADVTALAAILTGWGVDRPSQGGGYNFDYKRHEPGPKVWFGYLIDDNGNVTKLAPGAHPEKTFGPSNTAATPDSVKQGIAALNILAMSPQTAHFISYLLAQYFVADNPPDALVDHLQKTYLASHGDIKTMLKAIIASPEFNSRQYFRNKVKTPEEFIASAFRATATDPQNPGALVGTLNNMGMPLYRALPPTGYYLTADQWMSSSALVNRLNFAYQLTNSKFANQKFDAPRLLATGLLTPSMAGDLSAFGSGKLTALPSASAPSAAPAQAKLLGVADGPNVAVAGNPGAQISMRILEATMIGAPVSAQTNQLIVKQLQQLPGSPTDTLNLLTALIMGSPEFQLR